MGRRQWARLDGVQRVGDVAVTVDDVDDLVTEVLAGDRLDDRQRRVVAVQ